MRDLIVDELAVGAAPELAAKAKALIAKSGNIAALLIAAGFAPRDVLQACCAVTGVPPAPLGWLRDPKPPAVVGLDADLCRRIVAAPVAAQNGKLCIAYADPEAAVQAEALGFPKHQAYLALQKDLDKALALLPPPAEDDDVDDESNLFDDELAVPDADGEEDDGRTVVSTPVSFDEVDAVGATAARVVAETESGDDDDEKLFDDPTHAVQRPPSAPKPSLRQQAGAVGEKGEHDTLVSAPTRVSPVAASMRPRPETASGASRPAPAAKKPPSMATPAHGSTREQQRGAKGVAPLVDDEPAETILTAAPHALAGARNHPAAAIPSAPPVVPRPRTPSPSGSSAASPSSPPKAARPAPPQSDTSIPPTVAKRVIPPVSADTQQAVLAALSDDDLIDDESSDLRAQPQAQPPPRPARAAAPSSPASPPSAPRVTPKNSAPPPPTPAKAAAAPPARAAKQQRTPTRVEPPATTPHDGTRAVAPQPSDDSAFASADAADQEVVQNQKQRLKRIAQIASIKRYKIDRVLGRGGMATVYYATDTKTGEGCALKLMEPHLAEDGVFVERFKREIRACTALNHENIVRVFDYGEEGGNYYMASEYVDGGTVGSLLKTADRPLPVALVVPIIYGFLDGLEHAHEQGFVHRDLKPANLMLTKTGKVKIGDFGIAKAQTDTTLTKTGALFGTPAYMSPEQAQGQELDTRSDLFGVGIIFYELLAGYNPYAHENPSTTMFAIAKGQARALFDATPTVPEAVEKVVQKLLEKDLKKRYQTAAQARDDLKIIFEMLEEKSSTLPGGNAVAAALAEQSAVDTMSKAQSLLESDRASKLLQRTPPEHAEAAFRFYKATLLDAQNYDASNGLTQLRADYGFRFTRPEDKQMIELEQSLEKKPDQPAVLRRLADLSATHRNLVDMAGFMKRYLRFFPNDTHVLHKLERIVGTDPLAPFSIMAMEAPKDETQAWSASDDMLDAARAAAVVSDESSGPGSNKSAVRPAARVGGQSKAGAARPGASSPSTPSTAQAPVGGRALETQRAGSAARGGDATAPVEPVEASPAKDSLEILLRFVKSIIEDMTRSLTGDQGFAAVKDALKDRFGEGGGDLKEVAKGALGKGKQVVADSLLKEEGRRQIEEGFTVQARRHWRLALVILLGWVLLIALGKGCAMACGSTAAPQPLKKVVDVKNRIPVDDDLVAKKKKPEPVTPVVVEKKPEPEPAEKMTPEEEARLLGEGKKATTAAPLDAKQQLAARQEELKSKAAKEPDSKKAIDLYSEAIDTDPYATGAREALMDRAKLYQKLGNLDAAEGDLYRLQRRPDYGDVKAPVEDMLAEIAKTRKTGAPPEPPKE